MDGMQIPGDLTEVERTVAGHLLELASDQFGNHGCNDFDLCAIIPDRAARDALVRAFLIWNGDPECYVEAGDGADYRIMDFALFSFLAARISGSA